ncbi:hypothetical protein V1515DRAFT_618183 [Lipomyces mesembrius]
MTAEHSKYSSNPHHPSPPAAEYNTRKRVGKACDSCRIKTSKCDGRKPCSRCIMDDKICTFTERKKSKERLYSSTYVSSSAGLIEAKISVVLLSKSGQFSINRALEELTSQVIELQKEECERFAIVHDHDESEQDTEHEHNHDTDSVTTNDRKCRVLTMEDRSTESAFYQEKDAPPDLNVDLTIAETSFSASQDWAVVPFLPVGTNIGAHNPETSGMATDFINPATVIRNQNQPEPMSPSSMTSASSLYSSSSTLPSPIDVQFSQSEIYDAFNDVDGLSDMWLTNTFMEI